MVVLGGGGGSYERRTPAQVTGAVAFEEGRSCVETERFCEICNDISVLEIRVQDPKSSTLILLTFSNPNPEIRNHNKVNPKPETLTT
jgi:hypothetical protein